MAEIGVRRIITEPSKALRTVSSEIDFVDKDFFTKLFIVMKETMLKHEAVGLAGIQIGYPYRVTVLHVPYPKSRHILFIANPRIIHSSKETISIEEGCLSCPGKRISVPRAREIEVVGTDPRWGNETIYRFNDLSAIVMQHELDHLDGKLIIDYEA